MRESETRVNGRRPATSRKRELNTPIHASRGSEAQRFRNDFLTAMSRWLVENEFIVGLPSDDLPVNETSIRNISKSLGSAAEMFGIPHAADLISVLLTSGASAEQAQQALAPYLENSDLVAMKDGTYPSVFILIYADTLTPSQIIRRLEIFEGESEAVTALGVRLLWSKRGLGGTKVRVFLVYTDPRKCDRHWRDLSSVDFTAPNISLRIARIDVSRECLQWSEPSGWFATLVKPLRDQITRRFNKEPFDHAALTKVLAQARELSLGPDQRN